jgi:hypothetical protein
LGLRQSVQTTGLGYVTAALLSILVVAGALLVLDLAPVAGSLIQYVDPALAWGQLGADQQAATQMLAIGVAGLATVTLICFSTFVGLSTHNAVGLGAEAPLLTPYRAGLSWASVLYAQVRIIVGLVVPAMIVWRGYTIPGLIAGIVAVEIAQKGLADALGWLTRPASHLTDLYTKLGVEGARPSPLASMWSLSFRAANLLIIAIAALPAVGLAVYAGSTLSGRTNPIGWQIGGIGPAQLAIAILVGCVAGLTFGSLAMLAPLTLGLVQRQRTRKTLARVGRSRSWVARPGEGGYAVAGPMRNDGLGGDPEDRIVERIPRYADPLPMQTPGFGGPAQNPVYGGPAAPPRMDGPTPTFTGNANTGFGANPNFSQAPLSPGFGPSPGPGPFGSPRPFPDSTINPSQATGFGGTVPRPPYSAPSPNSVFPSANPHADAQPLPPPPPIGPDDEGELIG